MSEPKALFFVGVSEKTSLRAYEYRLQMIRPVEVFCATRRHQNTKKNETQTKVRMAFTHSSHNASRKEMTTS